MGLFDIFRKTDQRNAAKDEMNTLKLDYPLIVHIFEGEGRIIVIPVIRCFSGYSIDSPDFFFRFEGVPEPEELGSSILESFDYIKKTVEVNVNHREIEAVWHKNTKYKSWTGFWAHNNECRITENELGEYMIYSLKRSTERKGIWKDAFKTIQMSKDTSAADIGNAVCDAFSVANKYYKNLKEEATINKKRITLQDGSVLIIREPKDSHFEDMEDCGAAEIYQCYEYRPNMDAEATAMFFIGIASELDCKLSKEAIEQGWEVIYGNADEFLFEETDTNIFQYRVEMKNGKYHKLSYFLKHEEDLLLECGMQVNQPNRRKKTDEKLTEQFHDFVKGCTIESVESSDSMSLL